MVDIYSNATRVVVWAGPDSHDSFIAMDCVEEVATKMKSNWAASALMLASSEIEKQWIDPLTPLPFGESQFLALYNLFHRAWFERLWIWQEDWLPSPKAIILMCGTLIVPWDSLRTTVFCLGSKSIRSAALNTEFNRNEHLTMLYDLCPKCERKNLGVMIARTNNCKCLDPRDKIFALLSLVGDKDKQLGIEPDYDKDLTDVYQDVVLRYVKRNQSLEILTAAERSEALSWVPDWSIARVTTPLRNTFAKIFQNGCTCTPGYYSASLGVSAGLIDQVELFGLLEGST